MKRKREAGRRVENDGDIVAAWSGSPRGGGVWMKEREWAGSGTAAAGRGAGAAGARRAAGACGRGAVLGERPGGQRLSAVTLSGFGACVVHAAGERTLKLEPVSKLT